MWYKILKIDSDASREEIEEAYRKLSQDPKVVSDMNKSIKVRDAYKEGLQQASDFKVPKKKLSKTEAALEASDSIFDAFRMLKLIVLIGVIVVFLGAGLFTVFSDIFGNFKDDQEDNIVYNSNLLNCIASTSANDFTVEQLKEELVENDYIVDVEDGNYSSFYKEVDDRTVLFEITEGEYRIDCNMRVSEEIETTWNTKEAILIHSIDFGMLTYDGEVLVFDVEYNVYSSGVIKQVTTVLSHSLREGKDEKKYDFFINDIYEDTEFYDYISEENSFELIDILKIEIENFEE